MHRNNSSLFPFHVNSHFTAQQNIKTDYGNLNKKNCRMEKTRSEKVNLKCNQLIRFAKAHPKDNKSEKLRKYTAAQTATSKHCWCQQLEIQVLKGSSRARREIRSIYLSCFEFRIFCSANGAKSVCSRCRICGFRPNVDGKSATETITKLLLNSTFRIDQFQIVTIQNTHKPFKKQLD